MYLSKIHIENYRLLRDVDIDLDPSLTLFVGKNNTGKTSVMSVIEFLLSDNKTLPFEDYPLECRTTLYEAVMNYWNSAEENRQLTFTTAVPITKFRLTFDYSDEDETYGELGNFILGLEDTDANQVIIEVSFDVPMRVNEVLEECKAKYDKMIGNDGNADRSRALARIVQDAFSELFQMNIVTVNPSNSEDFMEKNRNDLRNLFCIKVIKAERALDEADVNTGNPISQIMRKLFSKERDDVEEDLRTSLDGLQSIIDDVNFNVQEKVNTHMDKIVSSMHPFGYPDGEDLQLRANTSLDLERRITDNTALSYVSADINESLPEAHNGLGYRNLIMISMELHDYVKAVKENRDKIAILFIEEPEAHMHPQLQTSFVEYLEDFLNREAGEGLVQTIMTTHSSHVANTVSFENTRYIRRFKCKR